MYYRLTCMGTSHVALRSAKRTLTFATVKHLFLSTSRMSFRTLPIIRIDADSWLTTHTPYPATMSASDYKQYEKVRADSKLTMPGRLGVKESLHSMFMHTVGLCGLAKKGAGDDAA
jgi:hypothetical protein